MQVIQKEQDEVAKAQARQALEVVKKKQMQLGQRLVATQSEIVIRTLEETLETLETERLTLESRLRDQPRPQDGFTLRTALEALQPHLENPSSNWKIGNAEMQKRLARMVFPQSLYYGRNEGLRTTEYSLLYRISRLLESSCVGMVEETEHFSNQSSAQMPSFGLLEEEIRRCCRLLPAEQDVSLE
jgi:hypothetical protein